jgi:cytochrome c peroxidase
LCLAAAIVSLAPAAADDTDRFSRAALLARFDADEDGQLDQRERQSLREAFGGIDVPMLPDRAADYTATRLPVHANRPALNAADNTPPDNSTSDAGATLGRVLFYDTSLSRNHTIACASCHLQRAGFSDPRRFSVGFQGGQTKRNAMGLVNLRYSNIRSHQPGFFWDERAATLEDQVLMPIQDPVEMGMTLDDLERRLAGLPYYPPLFEAAFRSPRVTRERISQALAQFLRSMTSLHSRFDRAAPAGGDYVTDFDDFSAQENLGKSLFIGGPDGTLEHGCAHCHVPPTFAMTRAMNNGLAIKYADPGLGALDRPPNDPFDPSNDGKFKAPSLRNVALTAPYMHDGRFATLEQVIDHYSDGVHPHENLALAFEDRDPANGATLGLRLTAKQKAALIAFLHTLTDDQFVADARFADPFVRAGDAPKQPPTSAEKYKSLVEEFAADPQPAEFVPRFFQLAEEHVADPAAVDALVWIVTNRRYRPESTRAARMLEEGHLKSERIAAACPQLARVVSPAVERLLRTATEKSPHTAVRAQASFHLAALLEEQSRLAGQLAKDPSTKPRVEQYYGKELTQHLAVLDVKKVEAQREQLYAQIAKSFRDAPTRDGPMGELADKALFAMRHLSIGRQAPEIDAEDTDGVRFKLSDYRGKVVMLSFWGHW